MGLFDSLPFGMLKLDCDLKIIEVNPYFLTYVSFSLKEENILGKSCEDIFDEDCIVKSEIKTQIFEKKIDYSYFKISIIPEFLDNKHIGFIGFFEDISQYKEKELKIYRDLQLYKIYAKILNYSMSSVPLDEALINILKLIVSIEWFGFIPKKGSISLVEKDDPNILVLKAQLGFSKIQIEECGRIPFGECLCGKAAENKEFLFCDTITEDHEIIFPNMEPHGHYCFPLIEKNKNEVIGVLNLYVKEFHEKKNSEIIYLNTISQILVRIIKMSQLLEYFRQCACYDLLTGICNRVLFYDRLKSEIADSKREKTKFAVFYMDLDKFKYVNDHFGHRTGDSLLIEVVQRLTKCLRDTDVLARIGGDEFALITKISSDTDAELIAKKIIAVTNQQFEINEDICEIGISIGITIFDFDSTTNTDDLLEEADKALYKAKINRGTYVFADKRI